MVSVHEEKKLIQVWDNADHQPTTHYFVFFESPMWRHLAAVHEEKKSFRTNLDRHFINSVHDEKKENASETFICNAKFSEKKSLNQHRKKLSRRKPAIKWWHLLQKI